MIELITILFTGIILAFAVVGAFAGLVVLFTLLLDAFDGIFN